MSANPDRLPPPPRPAAYPVTSLLVTTTLRPTPPAVNRAQALAELLGAPLVTREGSLAALCAAAGVPGVITVGPQRVTYHEPARGFEYFYHPSMAKVRLHNCRRGRPDPLLQALDLAPGDTLLDCTLGRASDALVCAWALGDTGRIVGLEVSPVIAALTLDGLTHYEDPSALLTACLRRIEGHWADYHTTLALCPDRACDVVYFDPLFHAAVTEAQAMGPLRELADPAPLTAEALAQAARVARRRVVIKQRRGTPLWRELGLTAIQGSSSGRVEYGVLPC